MSKAEKFISDYTRNCSNAFADVNYAKDIKPKGVLEKVYQPWLTPDQARKAVEVEREEVIKNSVKWLKDNIGDFFSDKNKFIREYKQAMKDE